MSETQERGGGALRVIAVFKVIEAVLLVAAGCGALGLLDQSMQHSLVEWLDALSLREGRRLTSAFAEQAIDAIGATTVQRLVLIAIGCFVYAAIFLVEAGGLWFRKHWAEYLTIVVTASLLPFEIVELVHEQSAARIVTLVVNLIVVAYLIWRLATTKKSGTA